MIPKVYLWSLHTCTHTQDVCTHTVRDGDRENANGHILNSFTVLKVRNPLSGIWDFQQSQVPTGDTKWNPSVFFSATDGFWHPR